MIKDNVVFLIIIYGSIAAGMTSLLVAPFVAGFFIVKYKTVYFLDKASKKEISLMKLPIKIALTASGIALLFAWLPDFFPSLR